MANKRIGVTLDINADISKVRSAAEQLQNIFKTQGLGAGHSSKLTGMFTELDKALDDLQKKSSNTLGSMGDIKGLDRVKNRVTSLIASITEEFTRLGKESNIDLGKNFATLNSKIESASRAIKTYNTSISNIGKTQKTLETNANNLNKALAEQEKLFKEMKTIRSGFDKGMKDADILSALKQKLTTAKGISTKAQNKLQEFLEGHGGEKALLTQEGTIRQSWAKTNSDDAEALQKLIDKANAAKVALDEAKDSYETFANGTTNFKGSEALKQLRKDAEAAANEFKNFDGKKLSDQAFTTLKTALEGAFGPELTQGIENSANAIDQFKQRIESISAEKLKEFRNQIPEINNLLNSMGISSKDMGNKVEKGMNAFSSAKQAASELDHLTSRLKYFFSLAGGFQLMRRAIRSAVETTKELDAVMTQTAVVSKYSVGDMWKTLPEYSKYAKQLGSEIKDVYGAQTLYVQQGLDMNSAMDIGIETLKMARVAGIDAAEATNSMTAALRGFNMELNETSATRINDVYSKLAQNTASNVQEISTAMSKVAALANSANMSFENTSAFLATIIESTREGAETAGTALKTVIARFTEVKKLYSEGELSGTDEEGQEVDVNKISKALRTAGINMNDFFTGAKGLDEIFMELGSKWDSLSTVQQRYIATMAAGSRQQSRFLALMQNYSRTVELTNMAYNSAGSGQEQFEKTLDSLKAKFNKLKAAWDTFTMGIANSDAIKWVIDAGTKILDTLNSIIDKISGGNGAIKSVLSLATAFAAFKAGGAILKGGLGQIGAALGTKASNEQLTGFQKIQAFKARTANRFNNLKTGNQLLFNANTRADFYNDISGVNVEAAKKEAEQAQAAYNDARTHLASVQDPAYKQALIDTAKANGQEMGEAEAEAQQQAEIELAKKDASEKENNLTDANSKLTEETEKSNAALQKSRDSMQALGNAALMAGGMLITLASFLERLGTGGKVAAKIIKSVGIGLISFGSILKITQTAVAVFAKTTTAEISSIPIIGQIAAIISLLITLGSILYNFWPPSASEKLEQAKADADAAREAADSAADAYDRLLEGRDKYHELLSQIEELTEGTKEYKKAIQELNQEVMDMVNEYPDLEYHYNVEKGYLEIDEDSWNKAIENANKRKNTTRAVARMTSGYAEMLDESYNRDTALKENARSNRVIDYLDENTKARALKYLSSDEIKRLTTFNWDYTPQDYRNAFQEALKNFPNDIEIFSKATEQFSQALFELSGGSAGEKVLSDIYGTNFFQKFYNPTKDTWESLSNRGTDWKEWDFNEKAANGKDTKWEVIAKGLLNDGLIDTAQYDILKKADMQGWQLGGTMRKDIDNDWFYQAYAAITGTDLKSAKEIDYQQVVNYVGRYYESKEVQRQYEIDFDEFQKLPEELQEAWITASEDTGKLTRKQQNLLLNGGLQTIRTAFPYFDQQKFADLVTSVKTSTDNWEKNNINGIDYYNAEANSAWKRHNSFNENIASLYEDIFTSITSSRNLTDQQKNTILSALNSSDITSLSSLWGGLNQLKELGIDLQKIAPDIYDAYIGYINILDEYGIALNKYTIEQVSERGLSAQKIVKDHKDSKNRSFSKDEYETIKNYLVNTEYEGLLDNFIKQDDGTYKYFASDLGTIISVLGDISENTAPENKKNAEIRRSGAESLYGSAMNAANDYYYNASVNSHKIIDDKLEENITQAEANLKQAKAVVEGIEKQRPDLKDDGSVNIYGVEISAEEIEKLPKIVETPTPTPTPTPTSQAKKTPPPETSTSTPKISSTTPTAVPGPVPGPAPISREQYEEALKAQQEAQEIYDDLVEQRGQFYVTPEDKAFQAHKELSNDNDYLLTADEYENLTDEDKISTYNTIVGNANLTENELGALGLVGQIDKDTLEQYFPILIDILKNREQFEKENQDAERAILETASNENLGNISMYGEYEENRTLAADMLDVKVEEEGLTDSVNRNTESLVNNNEAIANNEEKQTQLKQALKANALEAKKAEKNFDDLTSIIKDNNDAMKSKDPMTRKKAFDAIATSARKAFNNENITSEFVENNQEAFKNFANGVEGSEREIRVALSNAKLDADTAAKAMSYLDSADFSVDGTADFSSIFAQLADLMDSAEEARAYLESLGYSVTWVVDGQIVDDVTGMTLTDYTTIVTDSAGSAVNRNRGGGGGGGGGEKEFKNDFDKYYNLVEDINELMRLRNLLETDYNQLLAAEGTSGKQIYDNLKKQVDLLKERQKLTADLAEKRKGQIFDLLNDEEYKDVKQYAWWNEEDQTIEIDWDAINEIKDSETGNKIKKLVQKLEDFQSKYDEQIEALEEIEDALEDIRKRGRDEYISLEERLRDALIAKIQEQIDEQSATNEAIDTANSNLMDSIQKALEQQRQERENAKTEEELADKEQRLAYLQQDSSGANAVEIAQLQKELDEAREDYTDQLIDQKISELQEQNDEAAQQRQEQIDLMQQSLDWQEKNGEFWEQAYQILEQSIGPDGSLLKGSELEQLLKSSDAWQGLSAEGKMKWLEELEKMVAQATGYLSLSRQLEDIGTKAGEKITFTNAEGKTLTGVVDENGNVVVTDKNGNKITYKDVYQDYFGKYHTLESEKDAKTEKKPVTSSPQPQEPGSPSDTGPKYTGSDYEYINDQTCMEHKHYSDGSTKNSAGGHNIVNEVCKKCGHSFKKRTGGGCFAAGTKIIMSDFTTKNIEDVLIGDEVIAYNEEKELFEFKKVTKSYKHYNTPRVIKIILSNNVVLKITPGHPILTTEGWKSRDIENSLYEHNTIATWLNIGDQVIGYSGIAVVENIVEMEIPNNYITYNIEVEVCHTYLADGIVVHNMKVEGYATGGLNTKTGPAWLDGTKSHPELVLNARDTENFIQLKDHLATLRQMSTNGLLGAGGDNYYDIDVHVDSLGSDYDVDMAIDRIKARIYQDGAYRNVNTLNRLR